MKKKSRVPAPAPKPAQKKPAPAKAAPKTGKEAGKAEGEAEGGTDFSQVLPTRRLTLDPTLQPGGLMPGGQGLTSLPPDFFSFKLEPPGQIDWLAMRQPFLSRGVPLTDRDHDAIVSNWQYTVKSMTALGLSPDLAVKIANLAGPIAYDFSLKRDYPTAEERFDMAMEKMLPPGEKLPTKFIVPVITPDTLNFVTKKLTGKDIDFRF